MIKSPSRKLSYVIYGIASVVIFLILLARQSASLWHPPMVAETGTCFLSDALNEPFWSMLFAPCCGYTHVAARCVAWLASVENLMSVALLYRLGALAVAACILAFPLQHIFNNRIPFVVRLVLVFLAALVPWNTETGSNLVQLHWYLFYYLALLSMADIKRASIPELIGYLFFAIIAVFSTPMSIVCAPVFAVRYFRAKTQRARWTNIVAVVLIVGGAFIVKILISPLSLDAPYATAPQYALFLVKALGYNVICMTALGGRWTVQHCQSWTACYVAWMLFFALLICSSLINGLHLKRRKRKRTYESFIYGAVFYYLLMSLVLVAVMEHSYVGRFVNHDQYGGIAYCFSVSAWFFLLIVVMKLYTVARMLDGWGVRIALGILVCGYAMVIQRNFLYSPEEDHGWYEAVNRYYEELLSEDNDGYEFYYITLRHESPWEIKLPFETVDESVKDDIRTSRQL